MARRDEAGIQFQRPGMSSFGCGISVFPAAARRAIASVSSNLQREPPEEETMNFTRRQAMKMIAGAVPAVAGARAICRCAADWCCVCCGSGAGCCRNAGGGGYGEEVCVRWRLVGDADHDGGVGADCAGGPRGLYASGDGDADELAAAAVPVGVHDAWAARGVDHRVRAECVAAGVGAAAVFYWAGLEGQRPGLGAEPADEFVVVLGVGAVRRPAYGGVDWDCDGVSAEQAVDRAAQCASGYEG